MKDPHDIRKAAIEDELIARSEERESTWLGVCPKCHYATDHCRCAAEAPMGKCKHDLFPDICPYCESSKLRAENAQLVKFIEQCSEDRYARVACLDWVRKHKKCSKP